MSWEAVTAIATATLVLLWNRLSALIIKIRAAKDWPQYCEWFQWLAEQFEKRGRLQHDPA